MEEEGVDNQEFLVLRNQPAVARKSLKTRVMARLGGHMDWTLVGEERG